MSYQILVPSDAPRNHEWNEVRVIPFDNTSYDRVVQIAKDLVEKFHVPLSLKVQEYMTCITINPPPAPASMSRDELIAEVMRLRKEKK